MKGLLQRGLYVITDSQLIKPGHMVHDVAAAIAGGAVAVQYRDKGNDLERRLWEAQDLANLCRSLRVPLIINDDVELAKTVHADGVHLGRDDGDIQAARATLGEQAIIGISCYNELKRAHAAQAQGADYVAFGRFFPSSIKPDAVQADIELLEQASRELQIPIIAIGGITAENGGALVAAGADMLAVISEVFGQDDVHGAAERLAQLYAET